MNYHIRLASAQEDAYWLFSLLVNVKVIFFLTVTGSTMWIPVPSTHVIINTPMDSSPSQFAAISVSVRKEDGQKQMFFLAKDSH